MNTASVLPSGTAEQDADCCYDPRALTRPRPFAELARLPAALRVPARLALLLTLAVIVGAAVGWSVAGEVALQRFARALFFASAAAFIVVVAADFAEHFRLERELSGSALRWRVVPLGETALHLAIGATLSALVLLARPIDGNEGARDWLAVAAPVAFVALGWADELYYHRRRAMQREHILHTVSHLAAAATLVSFAVLRFVRW